jgi:hypothetical protein
MELSIPRTGGGQDRRDARETVPRAELRPTDILKPAQCSQHSAVDDLHSIANKQDTVWSFLLTLKLRRVKTYSFFDIF